MHFWIQLMITNDKKLCIDCKWFHRYERFMYDTCRNPKLPLAEEAKVNYVTGEVKKAHYMCCDSARKKDDWLEFILRRAIDGYSLCGPKGRHWEPKQ